MRALLALALVAACGGPRFLGERLPSACSSSYSECEAQLELASWRDGFAVEDRALAAYVNRVGARVVHASTLDYMPQIVVMPVGSAEILGRNIVIGRATIAKLGSEAQLAGILAHETAHLEAGNNETSYIGAPVDEESLADERAVALLVRAGYSPDGMSLALARLDDSNDPYHPPMKLRIQRTSLLATLTGAHGDERRAEFLHAIDGIVIGSSRERGLRGDGVWLVADRDAAIPILTGVEVEDGDDTFRGWRGHRVRFGAWRLGVQAGVEAVDAMRDVEHVDTPIGRATIGTGLPDHEPPDGSLARLLASKHQRAGKVDADEYGAVIQTPRGALLLTVKGPNNTALLRTWLTTLRAPTIAERALAGSTRLRLTIAPRAARVRDLVAACVDREAALALDDPDRTIRAGEPFKCTDR